MRSTSPRCIAALALLSWCSSASAELPEARVSTVSEQPTPTTEEVPKEDLTEALKHVGKTYVSPADEAPEPEAVQKTNERITLLTSTHGYFLPTSHFLVMPAMLKGGNYGNDAGKFPFLFDARIAPHLFFYSGLPRLAGRSGWAQAFSFSPEVQLRMLTVPSEPVRTPSYRPTLTYQVFRQIMYGPKGGQPTHGKVFALRLFVGHYSNGQDGCTYQGQKPEGNNPDDCRPAHPMPAHANHKDGDFSTNRAGLGLGYVLIRRIDKATQAAADTRSAELWGEYNIPGGVGGIDQRLKREYGGGLLGLQINLNRLYPSDRFSAFGGRFMHWLGPKRLDLKSVLTANLGSETQFVRAGWDLSFAATLERADNFGLLLRSYYGYDYYNINFDTLIWQCAAGIIWSGSSGQRFTVP